MSLLLSNDVFYCDKDVPAVKEIMSQKSLYLHPSRYHQQPSYIQIDFVITLSLRLIETPIDFTLVLRLSQISVYSYFYSCQRCPRCFCRNNRDKLCILCTCHWCQHNLESVSNGFAHKKVHYLSSRINAAIILVLMWAVIMNVKHMYNIKQFSQLQTRYIALYALIIYTHYGENFLKWQ